MNTTQKPKFTDEQLDELIATYQEEYDDAYDYLDPGETLPTLVDYLRYSYRDALLEDGVRDSDDGFALFQVLIAIEYLENAS